MCGDTRSVGVVIRIYLCITITLTILHNSRVSMKRGRFSLSPFASENLVSRDGFGRATLVVT